MEKEFDAVRKAAYSGDFDLFKSLLEGDSSLINRVSQDKGNSPSLIQFIVVEGGLGKIPRAEIFLQFLIDSGSRTEKQLVAAASVNAKDLIDVLIASGVPLDDGSPWTALEECLYWGHRDMADYLVEKHGVPIKTLIAAAMLGNLKKLKSFFDEKKKVLPSVLPIYYPWGEIKDSTEQDALTQAFLLALSHHQYETADELYKCGVDINAKSAAYHIKCTPLNQAVYLNDRKMVDWLIDRGAVNPSEDCGADVIEMAKFHGFDDLAEHLKIRLAK